jgi:cell shape-determining protein MreD
MPWTLLFVDLLLVALHVVLRIGMGLGAAAPDLLVVALLLSARALAPGAAAWLGFALGIVDGATLPAELFGYSALVLSVLGYLAARVRPVVAEGPLFLLIYLFLGKLLFDVLFYSLTGGLVRLGLVALLIAAPASALYASVAGLLVWLTVRRAWT